MVFLIVSIQSCILFSILSKILSKTLILNMNILKNKSYKYFIRILKPNLLIIYVFIIYSDISTILQCVYHQCRWYMNLIWALSLFSRSKMNTQCNKINQALFMDVVLLVFLPCPLPCFLPVVPLNLSPSYPMIFFAFMTHPLSKYFSLFTYSLLLSF